LAELRALRREHGGYAYPAGIASLQVESRLPHPLVVQRQPARLQAGTEPGGISIPLSINGKAAWYELDTGSIDCLVTEAEAARIGLTSVDNTSVQVLDSSGHSMNARLGAAANLSVGGFCMKGIHFAVTSKDLQLSARAVGHQGIIGLSLLRELATIRWSKSGLVEIGYPSEQQKEEANLAFDRGGANLMVRARAQDRPVNVLLDSGANLTWLRSRFAQDFPGAVTPADSDTVTINGAAASASVPADIVKVVTLDIGGSRFTLDNVRLLRQEVEMPWYHATAGVDLWRNAATVALDFEAMTLRIR
jgi:predicted aspartyl protease